MLRAFVLFLLLVNGALYWWLQSDPHALQADREPQRLNHQVSPDAIQVLPDLPAAASRPGSAAGAKAAPSAASAASSPALAASGIDLALAPAAGASVAGAFARKTSDTEIDCSETPPIDQATYNTLKAALLKAGVPPGALAERRQPQGGSWMVYLGRYPDAQAWQKKADEMRRLDVRYERVNAPAALAPGLSLGQFSSQPDATRRLGELTTRGVRGARLVTLTEPIILLHLQVRATDPAWHHATGAQPFRSCPVDPPATT